MIVRPCPDALDCPPDQPLDNFSSEGDDTLDFISTQYGYINPQDRLWNKTLCNVTFISDISQADADAKATAAALNCGPCEGAGCSGGGGGTFCNTEQNPCVTCPDGSLSCYKVAAGTFCGFINQESADSAAFNFGLLQARKNSVCISSILTCACVGQAFSTQLSAPIPSVWSFDGGTLPPGLTFQFLPGFVTAAIISGIPLVSGQYTFRIRATTSEGTFSLRTYTISVIQIVTTSLPDYQIGVPYSFQLQATGGSGNYNFKISSGSLPNGLTMSITGLISGTPL